MKRIRSAVIVVVLIAVGALTAGSGGCPVSTSDVPEEFKSEDANQHQRVTQSGGPEEAVAPPSPGFVVNMNGFPVNGPEAASPIPAMANPVTIEIINETPLPPGQHWSFNDDGQPTANCDVKHESKVQVLFPDGPHTAEPVVHNDADHSDVPPPVDLEIPAGWQFTANGDRLSGIADVNTLTSPH